MTAHLRKPHGMPCNIESRVPPASYSQLQVRFISSAEDAIAPLAPLKVIASRIGASIVPSTGLLSCGFCAAMKEGDFCSKTPCWSFVLSGNVRKHSKRSIASQVVGGTCKFDRCIATSLNANFRRSQPRTTQSKPQTPRATIMLHRLCSL